MKFGVVLLRHGRSLHNEWFFKRLYSPWLWSTHDSGIVDPPLSPKGEEQCRNRAFFLQASEFDLVICSPLTRALQTLDLVLPNHNVRTIVTPLVKERRDRLADTGKPLSTLKVLQPKYEFLHFDDELWPGQENFKPESHGEFLERIFKFQKFFSKVKEEKILIVSHGNFIKTLRGSMFMLGNCSDDIACKSMLTGKIPFNL